MKEFEKTKVRVKALNWKDHKDFISNVYVNESGRKYVYKKEIIMADGKKHNCESFIALDMLTGRGIKFLKI